MKNPVSFRSSACCNLFIVSSICMCFPATFSGTVLDRENSNKPIPGVLVSVGHSTNRTFTDEQGHFTIDASLPSRVSFNPPPSRSSAPVLWNKRKGILDFSKAPCIAAISIFNLNGSCLFHEDIQTKNRFVRIPSLSQGIFIIKAVFLDKSAHAYSWKWSTLAARSVCAVPFIERHAIGKSAAANGETQLLFRHDDYFPFQREMVNPAGDLVITLNPDPRRIVFDRTKIHSYYFTMTREDSLSMEKNAKKEQFVPADFTFDNVSYGKVGLRFKGSQYYLLRDCFDSLGRVSSNSLCAKVSMKIKFDKYNDTARFYSMKRLNLHAMSDDPSKMHEMVCYGLFRDMGIYASKTAYIKLYINGSLWGLFLAVEELDGRFTKSRWPSAGEGNLFKEVWPTRPNPRYYDEGLVTNNDQEDVIHGWRMAEFCKAITNSTKETFAQNISPFMNLDYWLRYIAVDRAIHNADGIMTWYYDASSGWTGNHNFYFYEEENPGGKLWILPWDLPATLTKTDMIIDDYGVPDWNVAPQTCDPMPIWSGDLAIPPHCDKLTGLTADALWSRFVTVGEQLLATCLTVQRMQSSIDSLRTLIAPVIADDPSIDTSTWSGDVAYLRATMDDLNKGFDEYIHNRTPAEDTTGYGTPFPDSGFLLIGRVNNFEFTPRLPPASWTFATVSAASTISCALDTATPLWGKSDLLCSFVFLPFNTGAGYTAPQAYLFLKLKNTTDCRNLKRIRMDAKCDAPRNCRIFLWNKPYEQHNVNYTYGWSRLIGPSNSYYTFTMDQIGYPQWAPPDSGGILDTVLASLQGIGFSPEPRLNNIGTMGNEPDSGYMRIDNIVFEF